MRHAPPPAILTYHSLYSTVPEELQGWIHNVHPDEFHRQMRWCRSHFDMVDLDGIHACLPWERKGRIAITFDDGNETAFSMAAPILEELGIPATFFLTGDALDRRPGWRDKIRLIIARGWTREFSESARPCLKTQALRDDGGLFRVTKSRTCHSGEMERLLDGFLARKGTEVELPVRHRIPEKGLPRHPLIRYGNHTERHYLLAGLSEADQEREIAGFHGRLEALVLDPIPWFAVPFGRAGDMPSNGLGILERLGYRGCLWNQDGVAAAALRTASTADSRPCQGLVSLGRKNAPSTLEALQRLFLPEGSSARPEAFPGSPSRRLAACSMA